MMEVFYRSIKQASLVLALAFLGHTVSLNAQGLTTVQSENFDGCVQPAGWQNNILVGFRAWQFNTNGFAGGSLNGTCAAVFDDDAAGSGQTNHVELISPPVNTSAFGLLELRFHYNSEVFGSHTFQASVWDGSAWIKVFEETGNVPAGFNGQVLEVIDVAAYRNANFQVKFEYIDQGDWSWGVGMDNFTIQGACFRVNLASEATVCEGQSIVLGDSPLAENGTDPYTYLWSPDSSLSSATAANPIASPSEPTTYTVLVSDSTGCTVSQTISVSIAEIDSAAIFLPMTDYCIDATPDTIDIQPGGNGIVTGPGVVKLGETYEPFVIDNGPYVNSFGTGPGGSDASQLQNVTLLMNLVAFGHQQNLGLRVAEDLVIPENNVFIDSIAFVAMQIGSGPNSTISGVSLRIWDNSPAITGSNVLFGDPSTNRMIRTAFTGVYRTLESAPTNTAWPQMRTVVDVGGFNLDNGTYWLDWASTGLLGNGPWVIPITITGQIGTGNAIQFFNANWNPLVDVRPQGLPYTVYGRRVLQQYYIFDPALAGPGTHVLTHCYTNLNGCEYCDTFEVTVHPLPVIDIESAYPLCLTDEKHLTATPPNGTWSGNGIIDAQSGLFSGSAAGIGLHKVYYELVDENGCYNIDSIEVLVWDIPLADAGRDVTICEGETVIIGGSPTGTPGSHPNGFIDNYQWMPQFPLSSSVDPNPAASPTTTTTYVVTVQDNNGCIDRDTMTVFVWPAPVADAGSDVTNCVGSGSVIGGIPSASGGTPPYNYTWMPANGLSNPNLPNPVATPGVTTTYTLTVVDENGCESTDVVTVIINNAPVADAGMNVEVCSGVDIAIGGSPTAAGGVAPYTYSWTPSTGLSSTTIANPTFTASNLTATNIPYTFYVTVTDAFGCSSVDQITVTVYPGVIVDAGVGDEICFGGSVKIGGLAPATNGIPPYNYNWGPTVGLITPTVPNPTVTPTSSTIYTLNVTDDRGCTGTGQVTIIVNELPVVEAGPDQTICRGTLATIGGLPTANGGLAPYTYNWNPYIGLSSQTVPNPTASPNMTTTYTLVVTDAKGCEEMDVVTVFVVEGPKANAGVDKAICFGESIEIGAKPAGSGGTIPYLYVWTPGSSLTSNVAENPIASPQMTTTYFLTVYDGNNCEDTDSMVVVVNPLPIPEILGLDDLPHSKSLPRF